MGNKSNLTVYKASAGSGKTFRLAVQYIIMLVNNPENYRHILAVTFTNKATAEMKQRILSQLYGIGHNLSASADYYKEVKNAVTYNEQTIRHNALLALDMILQDYGRFRVETIDSFFQTVLRSLARELHIGANLTLELDTEAVIDEAVDSFLAGVEQDSDDKRNIMAFVESNIDNDRNWSIDGTLKKFSAELFREIFMEKGDELRQILSQPDAVADYKHNLTSSRDTVLPGIVEKVKATGQEMTDAISSAGSSVDELNRFVKPLVEKIAGGTFVDADLSKGKTLVNCLDDPDKFYDKGTLKKSPYLSNLARERLAPLLSKAKDLYDEYNYYRNSYDAALQYIHELSLLLDIRAQIDRQSQEQSRFILADTPQLLSRLSGSDTSFVYEKTGSFIEHLMIDEFQDTSRLQWGNLYLLLWECLANGKDCLVVGDVKQSIYRWRNSDWNILNSIMEERLAVYHPEVVPMKENRRSHQNIIDFNNALFPNAVEMLAGNYETLTGTTYPALEQAYSTVRQICPKDDGIGYVYVRIDTKDDSGADDKIFKQIAGQLDQLTAAGVRQTDIAILCRKGRQITDIAEWFAANRPDYRMISSEAFQLGSSVTVRILINALKWLSDSTDRIALAHLAWEFECSITKSGRTFDRLKADGLENSLPAAFTCRQEVLRSLPLYELAEKLYSILELNRIPGQDQYVMAFFDTLCQWLSHNPGEVRAFLDDWDSDLSTGSIPATDAEGIRLLTIHKSKGLEFHTVIVPYCDWSIIDYQGAFKDARIWTTPKTEPFNQMPLLPVAFTKKLGNSGFSDDYRQEAGLQTVDNLNLLYVAFTRAESNLIVLGTKSKTKTKGKVSTIADVMAYALSSAFNIEPDENNSYIYENGEICAHQERKNVLSGNPFDSKPTPQPLALHTYPINARFRQSGESTRFVHSTDDSDDRQEEYIQTGKLLHNLFATIRTETDIDAAVDKMLSEGLLESRSKAESLKQEISGHIDKSGVHDWFNGNYMLFNESSIIFRDGGILQTRRPDRVMIRPDGSAVIVDFKFGREREEYLHQVQEYMDLLHKMGYAKVEGHIWYVYSNKITDC